MTVTAKMLLTDITAHAWSGGKTLTFRAVYDPNLPEDERFAKATPAGEFKMTVDNPAALEQFELGKHYFVDFRPVAAAAPEPAAA